MLWRSGALGRKNESQSLFQKIYDFAIFLASRPPKIDYFVTSLPAMPLFEEDIEERQNITVLFMKAQALLGLGRDEEGRKLLEEVLAHDHNHTGALDLQRSLGNLCAGDRFCER